MKRCGLGVVVLEDAIFGNYPALMDVISGIRDIVERLTRSRAGFALLILASAAAIFLAGARFGEFLAIVTGAAR